MAVRKIETELALTGEQAFNDQMKAVNSNLKTLKSDMAAVTAEFDGNADSVEALTARQSILQDSVDQQRVKVDALRSMYEKVAETYGENSAQADKYKQQLNNATVALYKETAALEKNAQAMQQLGEKEFADKIHAVDDSLKTLASDLALTSAEYESNAGSVEALTAKQKILQSSIEQHNAKVEMLRGKYQQVVDTYGEASSQANEWKRQLNDAAIAAAKATASLEANAAAMAKNAEVVKQSGEKEFADQINTLDDSLKTLASDLAVVTASYGENTGSVEALTAKQNILQDSVEQHIAKVKTLSDGYQHVVETYGEASAQANNWKRQLNEATIALSKESTELAKTATALESAQKAKNQYVPITQRAANAVKDAGDKVKDFAAKVSDGAHHVPVLGEAMDVAKVAAKGLDLAAEGAKIAVKGLGTVASASVKGLGSVASGIGKMSAAAAKATAAVAATAATLGTVAITAMVNFAKESAEAAKAANEAGETLTESQEKWLAYSNQLDALDASVANAKSALGGILLPMLGELSTEGAAFLNDFARDMEAAAGDTEAQTKVLSDYIIKGAKLIMASLPEYIQVGKELLAGLGEGLAGEAPALLGIGFDLCMDLLNGIIEFAPELAAGAMELVGQLTQSLTDRGPDLLTSAIGMVTDIVRGLAQAAPDMIPAAVQLVSQLLMALVQAAPDLLLAGLELVYGILSGIFNALPDLGRAAITLVETLISSFGDKAEEFLEMGSKIVNLLKDGIASAWTGLVSWFNGIWESLFGNRTVEVDVTGNASDAPATDGSHAGGLDYVPFDGYLAELHRGEMVLTSAEAALYRRGMSQIGKAGATVNLYFYAKTITEAEINMVCDIVNRKLGEDL